MSEGQCEKPQPVGLKSWDEMDDKEKIEVLRGQVLYYNKAYADIVRRLDLLEIHGHDDAGRIVATLRDLRASAYGGPISSWNPLL